MRPATHIFLGIHNELEWAAAQRAFPPPEYEVLLARRKGERRSRASNPNGVFIARINATGRS